MTDKLLTTPEVESLLAEFRARRTPGTPEREAYLARRRETRAIGLRNGGISVNGRIHFFHRVTSLKRVAGSKFRWDVESSLGSFRVEGGRHGGGTSRDWFVYEVGSTRILGGRHLDATSLINALRLIENC